MKKSNPTLHWDDFHIEGFAILFFLLGLIEPWFFLVSAIYIVFVFKRLKWILMMVLLGAIVIRFYLWTQQEIPNHIQGEAKVIEVIEKELYDIVVIRYQNMKYKMNASSDLYGEGDILYLKGEVKPFRSKTIPYGFDQKAYYLSQNIKGYVQTEECWKIDEELSLFSWRGELEDKVSVYKSSIYINALIFGEKAFDDTQNVLFSELGILYLFSLSGMHIYVFLWIIRKIFFYLSIPNQTQDALTLIIYLCFLYLSGLSFGILRLILMFLFKRINDRYVLELTKLDGIQITFFLMMMLNIHWIFHQGVLITYLILNMLYLTEFLYLGQKGYIKRLMMSTLIFFVILPFSNQVSLVVVLTLPVLIMVMTGPVFIGAILVFMIPELDLLYSNGIGWFESVLHWMNQKNFSFHIPSLDSYMIVLYYLVTIALLRSKNIMSVLKRSLMLVIVLCLPFLKFIKPDEIKVFFLDVGQGDSIYIENKSCRLMIDSYQYAESFLKHRGIYALDYLILTHSDEDHIKESKNIIDHFLVKQLVLSAFIDDYPSYSAPKLWVKSGDSLTCGTMKIHFLSPMTHYENRNLNSLVFQVEINRQVFLFTGDIEQEVEDDLIMQYGSRLKSDVLKVAHHGSQTSTSQAFLFHVNPRVAVISVGYENKFNFPSETVLQRLYEKNVRIYRTDLQGTILFTSDEKKEKWSVYLPFPS